MAERLPPPDSYACFHERIRCLCALHSASVTSPIRTQGRNAAVGGHVASKHQISRGGWAADLVPDDPAVMESLAEDARTLGLWALVESDHVHTQGLAPDISGG